MASSNSFDTLQFIEELLIFRKSLNISLRRSLLLAELSLAELSAYFWLNCLNFKSAELSLTELSGRDLFCSIKL